jgi:hypothetical protein
MKKTVQGFECEALLLTTNCSPSTSEFTRHYTGKSVLNVSWPEYYVWEIFPQLANR